MFSSFALLFVCVTANNLIIWGETSASRVRAAQYLPRLLKCWTFVDSEPYWRCWRQTWFHQRQGLGQKRQRDGLPKDLTGRSCCSSHHLEYQKMLEFGDNCLDCTSILFLHQVGGHATNGITTTCNKMWLWPGYLEVVSRWAAISLMKIIHLLLCHFAEFYPIWQMNIAGRI